MRRINLLTILIVFIILLLHGHPCTGTWVNVQWISDGDTVVLEGGERIRYNGINAPEIAHKEKGKSAEPYGNAAKKFNIKLVKAKKVRLEFDFEKRDRYGRSLAYVFLTDDTFVNVEMVANGFAYYLAGTVNKKYAKLLINAQREAMSARKGMWRDLKESRGGIIGNWRSKRFHLKTCSFGKKIKKQYRITFASRWDAFWAGYAPAKRCIGMAELFGQP